MSAGLTILADGVEWPLATFIDCYGFTRTDDLHLHAEHPLLSRDDMLNAVTASGELITDKPARHLPWGDVIAIKGRDGGGLQICGCLAHRSPANHRRTDLRSSARIASTRLRSSRSHSSRAAQWWQ